MKYSLKTPNRVESSENIKDIFYPLDETENQTWLFIAAHDCDPVLGAGLLLMAAARTNVKIKILVVSDGSQGYYSKNDRNAIVDIRRKETVLSYFSLGVKDVQFLNYPDYNLAFFSGRADSAEEDIGVIENFVGLQNSFTYYFRKYAPDRIFLSNSYDFHPDHRITYEEAMISVSHAIGGIWPELGEPMAVVPAVTEYAVYSDFATSPDIMLQAEPTNFKKKMEALSYFKSQTQLASLLKNLQEAGPVEFFRNVKINLYDPRKYISTFAE